MTEKKSEKLIVKFVTNQASQEEIEALTKWLEEGENQKIFKDFVKINFAIDTAMNTFDSTEVRKQFSRENVFVKRRFSSYYKYAAILVVALGSFYLYKNAAFFGSNKNVVVPKVEDVVLQLDDESTETIDLESSQDLTDEFGKRIGRLDKGKLSYIGAFTNGKLIYNTLRVPYGKKFEVQLSEGTIVHLNSGSSLRFPVAFLKNQDRHVYLVGEAYFEVSKDKKHPFTVNTQQVNVEVLGTKFNVSAYGEDAATDVVLVEGEVSLYKDRKLADNQTHLTPGLKGTTIKGKQKIATEGVNPDYYTNWLSGSLVFKNASFDAIIKKLERHYNVVFINKNKMLGKEIFNARFDNEPIEVVLKYFSDSYSIDYKIDEYEITIK